MFVSVRTNDRYIKTTVGGDVLDAPGKHRQSFVGTGLPDGPFLKLVYACPGRRGRRPLRRIIFL